MEPHPLRSPKSLITSTGARAEAISWASRNHRRISGRDYAAPPGCLRRSAARVSLQPGALVGQAQERGHQDERVLVQPARPERFRSGNVVSRVGPAHPRPYRRTVVGHHAPVTQDARPLRYRVRLAGTVAHPALGHHRLGLCGPFPERPAGNIRSAVVAWHPEHQGQPSGRTGNIRLKRRRRLHAKSVRLSREPAADSRGIPPASRVLRAGGRPSVLPALILLQEPGDPHEPLNRVGLCLDRVDQGIDRRSTPA